MDFRKPFSSLSVQLLGGALCMTVASQAYGYAEELSNGLTPHSTFHYELTRTLVRAAGFPAGQSERIAIACQATDTGTFQGYSGQTLTIGNTERMNSDGQFWHEARRGCTDSTGALTYPVVTGTCNTCDYFTDPAKGCAMDVSEATRIDQWGMQGNAAPLSPHPVPVYGSGSVVPGASLDSFGIYLHSLADSYSHEKCMQTTQARVHLSAPYECTVTDWHVEGEFGPGAPGLAFTQAAGMAVFRVAVSFARSRGLTPVWTESQAKLFIDAWAETDVALDRANAAISQFKAFN